MLISLSKFPLVCNVGVSDPDSRGLLSKAICENTCLMSDML